jgi:hypothetical protein
MATSKGWRSSRYSATAPLGACSNSKPAMAQLGRQRVGQDGIVFGQQQGG